VLFRSLRIKWAILNFKPDKDFMASLEKRIEEAKDEESSDADALEDDAKTGEMELDMRLYSAKDRAEVVQILQLFFTKRQDVVDGAKMETGVDTMTMLSKALTRLVMLEGEDAITNEKDSESSRYSLTKTVKQLHKLVMQHIDAPMVAKPLAQILWSYMSLGHKPSQKHMLNLETVIMAHQGRQWENEMYLCVASFEGIGYQPSKEFITFSQKGMTSVVKRLGRSTPIDQVRHFNRILDSWGQVPNVLLLAAAQGVPDKIPRGQRSANRASASGEESTDSMDYFD